MTDPALLAQAHALFERVLELDERASKSLLDQACAGQPELRALVEELLELDRAPHQLLDDEADSVLVRLESTGPPGSGALPGDIGPYRLIRELGRGGMATVYLAERDVGGGRQQVALKLVRRGLDTDDVVARFAYEARLLASLEHPNIARFYDVGVSSDGRPYLVMAFIEGSSLTDYCDTRRLGTAERIGLFETVCKAVQFAHQRLVVHRDLKPSNILVSDEGDVKLLDFGIAKLLDQEPDPGAPRTRTGVRVLTPEYAAPEQVRGEPVGTHTDVFALGVVLYELLTGERPWSASSPATGGRDGSAPFDPPPPSTAVRKAMRTGESGEMAAARGTTPERLRRALEGDLDRIVLKALEELPDQRYRSAEQLLDDLDRYRRGLPVLARPNTLTYRARKYVRRHRAVIAPAALSTLLLAAFGAYHAVRVTGERDRARAEAAKAQATTQFLQQLLGDAYPSVARGDEFSMDELLARATTRVDSLSAQPEIQAELLRTLGDIYREQGRFQDALPLLERAVAIHREELAPPGRTTVQALDALGHLYYEAKDFEAARRTHGESLDLASRLFAADDSLTLFAMNNVAAAASALGNQEEAIALHEQVLASYDRLFADTSELVHVTRNNLGNLYNEMGNLDAAEREFREALRLRRIALPRDHPSLGLTMNNLGTVLERLGRYEEAERLHLEALALFRRVYGPDHNRVALSAYNLARVLQVTGRPQEAVPLLRTTVDIDRQTYGARHLEVGLDLRRLGSVLVDTHDCESAVPTLAEADGIFEDNELPTSERRRLDTRANLGGCLARVGRRQEAEEVLLGSYRAAEADGPAVDSTGVRRTLEELVALYEGWDRAADAEAYRAVLTERANVR